jgi:ketosteroid isomerase-like protein
MSISVTPALVAEAYAALASGDQSKIAKYFAEDMTWQVPGHNQLSGWKKNRAEFLGFMELVGQLSGNTFHMESVAVAIGDDTSADVTHNHGTRASDPSRVLDIDVIHFLRWKDGKIVQGLGAIFGDGTADYDRFWA